jgi:hypothetical protein
LAIETKQHLRGFCACLFLIFPDNWIPVDQAKEAAGDAHIFGLKRVILK